MRLIDRRNLIGFWLPLAVAIALWHSLGRTEPINLAETQERAERGDPVAEYLLGRAYDSGEGLPRDPAESLKYYRLAAEHGEPRAQNNLASLYLAGKEGLPRDQAEGEKWLRKAAEQGAALAQDNLGLLLAQDHINEAAGWFRKAAEQGLVSAQLHLGNLYYQGAPGFDQDYAKAAAWLKKAAEQHNGWAANIMGVIYQNGLGTSRDLTQAIEWFRRGAEDGNAKAQSNLGQSYCAGGGVKRDTVEGYKWLSLGAAQNEITAIKFLDDFRSSMTASQIEKGQQAFEKYKLGHPSKKGSDPSGR